MEMLNCSVIRVFKTHYPMDHKPVCDEVVKDEVDFYAHTVLRAGIVNNAWYKIGSSKELGDFSNVLFRYSRDYGEKVKISERWNVWRINKPMVYVGKLTKEYQHSELDDVIAYFDIFNKLKRGCC